MEGLDHPGIIKLVDYHLSKKSDDFSYLVMNEIEQAQDLYDYLHANGGMTEKEALEILSQLLDAVEYLHTK